MLIVLSSFSGLGCQNHYSLKLVNGRSVANASDSVVATHSRYFNSYILKAVAYTDRHYRLRGYNINGVMTHDFNYLNQGVIPATLHGQTMCVAAQLEIMLTALQIYYNETHDPTPFFYLPISSWKGGGPHDIRAHIWVNSKLKSEGAADALANFGMGEHISFQNLQPGSFININRTNGTGHAVVFLSFIDSQGREQEKYNDRVVGFKYYSSQGHGGAGNGGMDVRHAIFAKFGCPEHTTVKRDCGVILSSDQRMLNTGMMLSPQFWHHTDISMMAWSANVLALDSANEVSEISEPAFDAIKFNGLTTDD